MRRGLLVWLVVLMVAAPALAQMAAGVRVPAGVAPAAVRASAPPMAASNGSTAAAGMPRVSNGQDSVNLDLRDVDVRAAIEALFKNSGKNFSIDANVTGTVPAVSFKDVPFDTALRNLTKTAGLVFRMDNSSGSEIYIISRKPEVPVNALAVTPVTASMDVVDQPTDREVVIEKVPLFHTSASEMLAMLGAGGREYGGLGGYGMQGYGMGGYPGGYGGYGGYGGSGRGYPSYGGYGGYGGSGSYPSYGGYGGYGGYGSYPSYGGYGGYGGYGNYGNSYRRSSYGGYGGYGSGLRAW